MPANISFFIQHNYTSEIPLNDANSTFADAYHLMNARLGWNSGSRKLPFGIYVGGDNLLNEKYSLGNDLNAAGDRYFNAAPLRSFYFGLTFGY